MLANQRKHRVDGNRSDRFRFPCRGNARPGQMKQFAGALRRLPDWRLEQTLGCRDVEPFVLQQHAARITRVQGFGILKDPGTSGSGKPLQLVDQGKTDLGLNSGDMNHSKMHPLPRGPPRQSSNKARERIHPLSHQKRRARRQRNLTEEIACPGHLHGSGFPDSEIEADGWLREGGSLAVDTRGVRHTPTARRGCLKIGHGGIPASLRCNMRPPAVNNLLADRTGDTIVRGHIQACTAPSWTIERHHALPLST